MPIPPYVLHLRSMIGTELLWMPGITAVVLRESPSGSPTGSPTGSPSGSPTGSPSGVEVLLVRRSDNGQWTPVTGIVDPGEDPHVTAVREVEEEACVVAEVERLVWVAATGVVTHVNGDLGQYLDHTFRCRWVAGDPRPGDDESTDARWFPLEALPPMAALHLERIAVAADNPADVRLGR